ncbi:MAG: IS1634 family transposase, partial [Bdellovibrionales bacterium]|nr:IS1634 family transposase [Bdellovibrionales bacterium]
EDELRRFGFSKNCRFKETQVVLALQTAQGGIPVGYELYPGNTHEGKTLIDAVKNHKELKLKIVQSAGIEIKNS